MEVENGSGEKGLERKTMLKRGENELDNGGKSREKMKRRFNQNIYLERENEWFTELLFLEWVWGLWSLQIKWIRGGGPGESANQQEEGQEWHRMREYEY